MRLQDLVLRGKTLLLTDGVRVAQSLRDNARFVVIENERGYWLEGENVKVDMQCRYLPPGWVSLRRLKDAIAMDKLGDEF